MATDGATTPLAKIGILSMGDMGAGIARLLVAKGFAVATNCEGRSQDTIDRAIAAGAELVPTDAALVRSCAVVLSVVPPADAEATARRVRDALRGDGGGDSGDSGRPPLYFADLNAVAPATCRAIAALFDGQESGVRFVDGSIIGGPPKLVAAAAAQGESESEQKKEWKVPLIPTSGPHRLADLAGFGAELETVLRVRHFSDEVGAASGLKMCFASMSKGYIAVGTQAFTTAASMGVLPELKRTLAEMAPARLAQTEQSLVDMVPKAYRWVREMEEISRTHAEQGGFERDLFAGAAGVYRAVAEDPVLGAEKIGKRVNGTSAEAVAQTLAEGLRRRKKKME